MQQTTSETERKVIDILVNHERTPSGYTAPIHAVDRAMGWATADTMKFVRDLVDRKLIQLVGIARDGPTYNPKSSYWKEVGGVDS
jgi:hypothetical protein